MSAQSIAQPIASENQFFWIFLNQSSSKRRLLLVFCALYAIYGHWYTQRNENKIDLRSSYVVIKFSVFMTGGEGGTRKLIWIKAQTTEKVGVAGWYSILLGTVGLWLTSSQFLSRFVYIAIDSRPQWPRWPIQFILVARVDLPITASPTTEKTVAHPFLSLTAPFWLLFHILVIFPVKWQLQFRLLLLYLH